MKKIKHSTFNAQSSRWTFSLLHWVLNVECWALNVPRFILISFIRAYQLTLSPLQTFLFGATGGCRYTPSCSAYAVEALQEHGAVTGTVLAARRICRCHPWGGCGHDPVPPKISRSALLQTDMRISSPPMNHGKSSAVILQENGNNFSLSLGGCLPLWPGRGEGVRALKKFQKMRVNRALKFN